MSRRGIHADQSRAKDDDCEACSYCGLEMIAMHHEHDHAPIPKAAGGTTVIPACVTCHDMKDRVTFPNWPAQYLMEAVVELVALGLVDDFRPEPGTLWVGRATRLPDEWADMSRWARIAWAKMARAAHAAPGNIPVL